MLIMLSWQPTILVVYRDWESMRILVLTFLITNYDFSLK